MKDIKYYEKQIKANEGIGAEIIALSSGVLTSDDCTFLNNLNYANSFYCRKISDLKIEKYKKEYKIPEEQVEVKKTTICVMKQTEETIIIENVVEYIEEENTLIIYQQGNIVSFYNIDNIVGYSVK